MEGKVEEEFTVARLYISKMRSEVKNLVQRCTTLETKQTDLNTHIDEREKELNEAKLLLTQHEAKMKTLTQSMKDGEAKKRALEEQVRELLELEAVKDLWLPRSYGILILNVLFNIVHAQLKEFNFWQLFKCSSSCIWLQWCHA